MYEIGDYFAHDSASGDTNIYILANTGWRTGARLIDIITGNRWYDSSITETHHISLEQFEVITNGKPEQFTRVTREEALAILQQHTKVSWEL